MAMPANSAAAPSAAPRMVPPLNNAWNNGITVRSSARSLAAPSTFIETSHVPIPRPNSARPLTTTALTAIVAPRPVSARPKPAAVSETRMVLAEPMRARRR